MNTPYILKRLPEMISLAPAASFPIGEAAKRGRFEDTWRRFSPVFFFFFGGGLLIV